MKQSVKCATKKRQSKVLTQKNLKRFQAHHPQQHVKLFLDVQKVIPLIHSGVQYRMCIFKAHYAMIVEYKDFL